MSEMRKKIFVNIDVKYCETAWIKGVTTWNDMN